MGKALYDEVLPYAKSIGYTGEWLGESELVTNGPSGTFIRKIYYSRFTGLHKSNKPCTLKVYQVIESGEILYGAEYYDSGVFQKSFLWVDDVAELKELMRIIISKWHPKVSRPKTSANAGLFSYRQFDYVHAKIKLNNYRCKNMDENEKENQKDIQFDSKDIGKEEKRRKRMISFL